MSTTSAFIKRAIERKRYTINYACWLATDEVLVDFVLAVTPTTDPPLSMTGAYADEAKTKISTYIGGGKAGQTYVVSCIATTSQGQTKRDDLQMRVT